MNKMQISNLNPNALETILANIKKFETNGLIKPEEASKLRCDLIRDKYGKELGLDIEEIKIPELQFKAKSPTRYQTFISYSHEDEKWINKLRRLLDILGGKYLFNWNDIPGKDSGRFIDYLQKNCGIGWASAEKIRKSEDKNIIEISDQSKSVSFKLIDEKTRAKLSTNFGITNDFNVESEGDKLKVYEVKNMITYWDDSQIGAGDIWEEEIQNAMASAKVAVLLVSLNFFSSKYIREDELPYLKDAADNHELVLLWISVGDAKALCAEYSLSEIQCVNNPEKPLNTLNEGELDTALDKIYTEIKNAASIS